MLNVLAALGESFQELAAHCLPDKQDHPDGPGAELFYRLRTDFLGAREARQRLMEDLRSLWPKNIYVDDQPVPQLHLGQDGGREVQAETVQYASCAAERVVDYVLTGKIPAHLARNALLDNRLRSGVRKRPAAM